MKTKATALLMLAMMATSFAQGPRQQGGGHRPPPPPPQEERAQPEQETGEKPNREQVHQEARQAREKARAERQAGKRNKENRPEPPRKPRPPVIKEPAASANIIMPFNPIIEPVVVPSQRFVVPKYS